MGRFNPARPIRSSQDAWNTSAWIPVAPSSSSVINRRSGNAGILAKFLAADALVERCGGQLVHLVLDGHRGAFGSIEWPDHDQDGSLRSNIWNVREVDQQIAMAMQPACEPGACPPGAPDALGRIADALRQSAGASNAALQQAQALDLLMDPHVGPRVTITTGDLMASPSGEALLQRMLNEAGACCDRVQQGHRFGSHAGHRIAGARGAADVVGG